MIQEVQRVYRLQGVEIKITLHTRTGRNQFTNQNILLEANQRIDSSLNSRLGQNLGGFHITQGLPRVEELFEARKPKGLAIITEIAGTQSSRYACH